jgi:hypothetical protein
MTLAAIKGKCPHCMRDEEPLVKSDKLSRSIAEYVFSRDHPCMYEGKILCRECPREECDMEAGRMLHQNYFVDGWLKRETNQ